MKPVLCVHWTSRYIPHEGWCAVRTRDVEKEFATTTRCDMVVNLPSRYETRVPSCELCLELLREELAAEPGEGERDG